MKEKFNLRRTAKRTISILMAVLMVMSGWVFVEPTKASADSTGRITSSGYNIVIGVPETIYMTPQNNYNTATTSVKYYVNNTVSSTGGLSFDAVKDATAGKFYIYSPQISSISSVTVDGATLSGFSATKSGSLFSDTSFTMTLSSGISSSKTKTLEWTIKCNMTNGTTATFYAYTVAYAPYLSPIFAATKAKNTRGVNSFGSGMTWVSGIHGISAEASYYPYDKFLPLLEGPTLGDSETSPDSWFNSTQQCGLPSKGGYYKTYEHGCNTGDDSIAAYERSAEGYINIDSSRYTNLNQVPNLSCGVYVSDAEGVSNGNVYAFVGKLVTDSERITTGGSWNKNSNTTPDKWNQNVTIFGGSKTTAQNKNYVIRNVGINNTVSNGWIYIRGGLRTYSGGDNCFGIMDNYLNVKTVDKSSWRTAVKNAQAYGFQSGWYSSATNYNNWKTYLKSVAEALGNPTVTSCSNVTNLNNAVNTLRTNYSGDNAAKVNDLGVVKVLNDSGAFSNTYKIINISGISNPVETESFYVGDTVALKSTTYTDFTYKCNVLMKNQKSVGTTFTNSDINTGLGSAGTGTTISFNGITQSDVTDKKHQRTFYYLGNDKTVTINPNGGTWNGSTSNTTVTGSYAGTFAPKTPTKTGYTFDGWTLSGGGSLSGTTYTFGSSAGTLTAKWKPNQYTITFKNGDTTLQSSKWNYNTTPTYSGTTPTKASDGTNHYAFSGWSPTIATVTGDKTYTAQYTTTAHTWTKTVKTSATCTTDGVTTYKCSCGYSKDVSGEPTKLGHSFTSGTYKDDGNGNHSQKCTRCSVYGNATAHTWNNGSITTQPSCTGTGVKTYTCTICNATKTEAVSANGHNYKYKYSATEVWQECTVCSNKINIQTRQKDIGFDNAFSFDSFIGSSSASNCSAISVANRTFTVSNNQTSNGKALEDGTAADSTAYKIPAIAGKEYYLYYEASQAQLNGTNGYAVIIRSYDASGNVIEVANYPHIYSDEKNSNGVELADTNGTVQAIIESWTSAYHGLYDGSSNAAANKFYGLGTTFTAPSNAAYFTLQFVADEGVGTVTFQNIILTTKEKWDYINSEDWSAVQGGAFPVHNNDSVSEEYYDFLGWYDQYNNIVPDGAAPAGNKVTSTTASSDISVWSAWQVHQYTSVVTAETCTEQGYTTYTCKNCGKTYKDNYTDALGHSWNNGVVTNPANCVDKGVKTFTCTVCNATKTEDIAVNPNNHKSIVTDPAVDATTDNVGFTAGSHCSACKKVLTAQTVIAPIAKSEVYEGAITSKIEGTFIGVTATEPATKISITALTAGSSADGSYGTVTINNSGKAIYKVTTMQVKGADTFWLLSTKTAPANNAGITTVYSYQKITVIPADRLYYEDTFENNKNNGITFSEGWTNVGTATDNAVSQLEDKTFEEAYNSCLAYSAGNAKKVTVSTKPWPYVEFTFAGTGFDIISATSAATGTFTITVTQGENTVQKKIVDTYYGYEYGELHFDEANHTLTLDKSAPALYEVTADDEFVIRANGKYYSTNKTGNIAKGWIENASNGNSLYQVPIISLDGLAYGVYTVKVEARYSSMFDHAKKGSYDLIFDAVRIHNPGGETVDGLRTETNDYISIREKAEINGNVLVDGAEVIDVKQSDVLKVSPNNEFYISKGQSLAFDLDKSGTKDVLVGMRSINGSPVSVTIVDSNNKTKTVTVSTATELYYSISEMSRTVTIRNDGNGILSLTNLKAVTEKGTSQAKSYMSVSAETAPRALAMLRMLDSDLSINPEAIETATDDSGKITLTVKTSSDVAQLIIYDADGNEITADEINSIANGDEITWTVTLTATESGTYTYSIQGAYENGYTSEDPVEITVKVELPEPAPEVTPDDEDNTEEENKKLTLFELIIRIIKRIIYKAFGISYE